MRKDGLFGDDEIISFARGTVRGGQDTDSVEDEDWLLTMRTMGARKALRDRIMTPGHDVLRLTKKPPVLGSANSERKVRNTHTYPPFPRASTT